MVGRSGRGRKKEIERRGKEVRERERVEERENREGKERGRQRWKMSFGFFEF